MLPAANRTLFVRVDVELAETPVSLEDREHHDIVIDDAVDDSIRAEEDLADVGHADQRSARRRRPARRRSPSTQAGAAAGLSSAM